MSKFIGRRIVPKHDGVWDISKEYEELSIVLDKSSGESYISRKPVPTGTAISDQSYWMQYSLYSAQIAEAIREMKETEAHLTEYVDKAESNINTRVASAESLTNSNKAELNSRMDTMDKRLDANVSASTDKDKDYAAEVVDARVDEEGQTYKSMGSHVRAIGSGKGILKDALNGSRLSFLNITPELNWTADKYIPRKYGGVETFSQTPNVYFATVEYISFPYGGCWIQVCSAMSKVESDKSGIAFYHADKKFIAGSDYNRETNKLALRRIFCPEGTAYMRMTCMGQENLDGVGLWLDDCSVSVGQIVDQAVTHEKLAQKCVKTDNLADESITPEKLSDGAVLAKNAAFLEIPLDIVLTPDLYISRSNGSLRTYTPGTNTYFATEDYLPFPYGGSRCLLRASMSTAPNDVSGLAFYDADKKYLSGLKYAQEKGGVLCYTEFVCPKGTEYIRLTMYKENLKDFAKIWFQDTVVSTGKVQDGAITTPKIADGAVTKGKLEVSIQKRLTAEVNDLLGFNLSDTPLERIRNDAGLMAIFRHVGCIGDSLASGEAVYKKADGSTSGKDLFEYSWGQYLARMTGNTYYNWSRGGLRCDTFLSSSMAVECFDGEHKCEAYVIGLGQNENNKKYTIGTAADIDMNDYTQNPDTYYGNYGRIIQKIQQLQPKAKIFVLTDPLKAVETAGYNAAVREIAGMFQNVYLVDLFTYGTTLYSSGFLYQQKRGGHFNAVGYFVCAMIIATYIDWIIKKNPTEFREVEFIGLDNKFY